MMTKHHLAQAKAFLCWDRFTDLSIKLVPLKEPVAFYYPPSKDMHTLVVFYPEHAQDVSQALFLLFHEAGHYMQYGEYAQQGCQQQFWDLIQRVNGPEKMAFEEDAWNRGAILLQEFSQKIALSEYDIQSAYADYAQHCLASYKAGE